MLGSVRVSSGLPRVEGASVVLATATERAALTESDMTKRIHKYTITQEQIDAALNVEGEDHSNVITMMLPDDAQILSCRTINMKPRLFALVDPNAKEVERSFELYPTGADIPVAETENGFTYVGCFSKHGKTFHVLELS
jgi:hypothetical protein